MEIVIRSGKNQLCIDYQNKSVGLTILTEDEKQIDFSVDSQEWDYIKDYIRACEYNEKED